ncbi:MAG: PIG-L deacetylase family protein [Jatrophihabitans sp.]|uniref:PIG-L deacetylase family protein n=1 Tax=Jatrophihabitans sp. TaxID=1932789 RepID=UPI003F81FF46
MLTRNNQLRLATTAPEAPSPAESRPQPLDAPSSIDLTELRPWPRRSALVIGSADADGLLSLLHSLDLSTAFTSVADAPRSASLGAPYDLVVVGPDLITRDEGIELLELVRSYSPSARVLLHATGRPCPSWVLVRALRAGVHDVLGHESDTETALDVVRRQATDLTARADRVLAIGAHPDDVEIGCAGTLLDHRLRGDSVTVLTLSRGAIGGDQRARLRESDAAAEAIGARLIVGDLPDTRMDSGFGTVSAIEAVVADVNPTVVYVHSKHDNHQDHRAVADAATSATRGIGRVYAYQSPSANNDYHPTVFLPIDHVLQRKIQVLQMFDSQSGRSYLEPELVVAGSRYWARHLGAKARYAEPFEVLRSTGRTRGIEGHLIAPVTGALSYGLPSFEPVPREQKVAH